MKRRIFSVVIAFALFFGTVCPGLALDIGDVDMTTGTTNWDNPNGYVYNNESGIPDTALYEAAVYSCDRNSDSFLSVQEVANAISLQATGNSSTEIKNLSGLEHFTNLEALDLNFQDINDLNPISNLNKLSMLSLAGNKRLNTLVLPYNVSELWIQATSIEDITQLGKCKKLATLLIDAQVQDFSPIKNLPIEHLQISSENSRPIRDFDSISDALSQIKTLAHLEITGFSINNLYSLSKLQNLKTLIIRDGLNGIKGIAALINLSDLQINAEALESIADLENMSLKQLWLINGPSDSASMLQTMKDLESLQLTNCHISSIKQIGELAHKLINLSIDDYALTTLDGIENFSQLASFFSASPRLRDIQGIENLSNLQSLAIQDSLLTNIDGIENLTALFSIDLHFNRILSSFPDITSLINLDLNDIKLSRNAFTAEELTAKIPKRLQESPEWEEWLKRATEGYIGDILPVPPVSSESGTNYIITPDTVIDRTEISVDIPKESGIVNPKLEIASSESSQPSQPIIDEMAKRNCDLLQSLDISLYSDNVKIEAVPNGQKITVSIYAPFIQKGKSYLLFRDNGDGTVSAIYPFHVADGLLKFYTDHFSLYAIGSVMDKYILKMQPRYADMGTATFTIEDNVYCIGDSVEVLPGTEIHLQAIPNEGCEFDIWWGSGARFDFYSADVTFKMINHSMTLTPVFRRIKTIGQNLPIGYASAAFFSNYLITATAHEGGSITDPGEKKFDFGDQHTYTILPNEGYVIDRVLVDGKPVELQGNTYTFENIREPYVIDAYFRKTEAETIERSTEQTETIAVNPATNDTWWKWLI